MSLSEFSLIDKIRKEFPAKRKSVSMGIGDDAAVIGKKELITTDAMVESVHFDISNTDYENLGYKSMATNVSDLAAMGGEPLYALLSIGLPEKVNEDNLYDIISGIKKASVEYSFDIIGGNTSSSEVLFLSVTMIGRAFGKPLYRSGARTGDHIYVTGFLGDSSIGLAVINDTIDKSIKNPGYFISRHYRPSARVSLIKHLVKRYNLSSCIDISDGLLADLGHIADESGIGFRIETSSIPMSITEIGRDFISNERYFLDFALGGGEDYELAFTSRGIINPDTVLKKTGVKITHIGVITGSMRIVDHNGEILDYNKLKKGYIHF